MTFENLCFPTVDNAKVAETVALSDPTPVVVVTTSRAISSVDKALALIYRFASVDDVYSPAFAETIVLQSDLCLGFQDIVDQFQDLGRFHSVYHIDPTTPSNTLPSGPYFLHRGSIHQAYRLYDDDLDSFLFGVIPEDVLNPKNSVFRYLPLPSLSSNGMWKKIAVPSRLYTSQDIPKEKSLSGARMGIKDIFRLEGTQLTMMNRSWIELYGPDEESAEYTKKLIALGGVIVGKSKMTSFASPEEATDQWIDFHCPVNPRGDRYQSPSSSSTGAGTSLAGYDWLDFSVAGDCKVLFCPILLLAAGSRALLFTAQFRLDIDGGNPSQLSVGIPPTVPRFAADNRSRKFDTVGQFARSLSDLHHIVSHTFENIHQNFSRFPSKILYPVEFYPLANEKQQSLTEEFITVIEDFLGVKRTPFSFVDEWEKSPPKEAEGLPLLEYTEKSAFWALCYDYYHGFDDFRDEYKAKFGKDAFASSVVRFRWNIGKEVTTEEYETYLKQLEVFRDWFSQRVMGPDPDTLSNAVLIMPYGAPEPEYRDEPNPPAGTFPTIAEKFISPILHAPQLVLPFAQMPYHSRISGRDEVRPIASTLVGAKGSDLMLIKLAAAAFERASWPTTVQTGRYMYPIASNSRNVKMSINDSSGTFEAGQRALQRLFSEMGEGISGSLIAARSLI
ncbi:unnamed protein product [Clonostachys rosea]|uniref:Amidase domain-containing protein n=1 Tax=Bionectria ochroleuca TaxID=29856 RepID=A0ABY6V2G6_BIOOC|nr:unnamed protein product [Clonostachys rosea]